MKNLIPVNRLKGYFDGLDAAARERELDAIEAEGQAEADRGVSRLDLWCGILVMGVFLFVALTSR